MSTWLCVVSKFGNHTRTRVTRFGNTAGKPVPVAIPKSGGWGAGLAKSAAGAGEADMETGEWHTLVGTRARTPPPPPSPPLSGRLKG